MDKKKDLILNHRQIDQKIRRMAFQIYESNSAAEEIILAGVMKAGFDLAQKMEDELSGISDSDVKLCQLKINKKDPLSGTVCSLDQDDYQNRVVVVTDDVLNTGTTLIYAVKHFLNVPLKKLQTMVLVDRAHKNFPVKADFKGISLSTSLNETVEVTFGDHNKVELF